MKRAGWLYERIREPDNLREAFWRASRGRGGKPAVRAFRASLDANLRRMHEELAEDRPEVGRYTYFTIRDPKPRTICAASFPERVLHHAVMNVCEHEFERYQIPDSYACRRGKGVDAALERARVLAARYPWFAKIDVVKFFDSIDHERLFALLSRRFKDPRLLALFRSLLESYETAPGKGLPIGNLTSQFFANLYLGALDHVLKDRLRVRGYVRYMDDMLVFGRDRAEVAAAIRAASSFLRDDLALELHEPVVNRCERGIPFLGYVVNDRGLRLSLRSKRRFRSKMDDALRAGDAERGRTLLSFVERANARAFLQDYFRAPARKAPGKRSTSPASPAREAGEDSALERTERALRFGPATLWRTGGALAFSIRH